jgi:hypothetical protein
MAEVHPSFHGARSSTMNSARNQRFPYRALLSKLGKLLEGMPLAFFASILDAR